MLTISDDNGVSGRVGMTRRGILRVGALTLGGLTLGDVHRLRAESPAPGTPRPRSVIMIFLGGGPSHIDMYDMKPGAPSGYRGEFRPIQTNVPGIEICELMPMQASIADKFTILRGVQLAHLHTANEFYSGYPWQQSPRASVPGEAQRPAMGSVVSRLRGGSPSVPPYISLENQPDWERAYYLGGEHEPFRAGVNNPMRALEDVGNSRGIDAHRLLGRGDLLHALDGWRRDLDNRGAAGRMVGYQARALGFIASGSVRKAFDVAQEPERVRIRYGDRPFRVINQESNVIKHHEVTHPGRALLLARRLAEAGVAVVTCAFSEWDTHRYNFSTLRQLLPPLDQALYALVTDLEERGLLQEVAIVMGGEFGRRPRIGDVTPDGRTHWPNAGFLWVAGGGLNTGQVIGATDARGEYPIGNPIRMQNVMATLYRVLGIDSGTIFHDLEGRPLVALEDREPVTGLLAE